MARHTHFVRTALECSRLSYDPWFVVLCPGIGLIGLVVSKAVLEPEQGLKVLILK